MVKLLPLFNLFYKKLLKYNDLICHYFIEATVCNGDSGSGMYFVEKNFGNQEVWHLRGLASLTVSKKDINICDPNELTVFTDVAQFHDFLADNV